MVYFFSSSVFHLFFLVLSLVIFFSFISSLTSPLLPEDDFVLESTYKPKELVVAPTGNTELDSLVSGFNMFGIAPELAEMMRQAAEMAPVDDPEPTYSGMSSGSRLMADDPLDSILNSLNSALDGLDLPGMKPAPGLLQCSFSNTFKEICGPSQS